MTGLGVLRKAVRWSFVAVLPGELVLLLCLASGVRIAPAARVAVELLALGILVASVALLALECHRHRSAGLDWRAAVSAAVADAVPASIRRLIVHELRLFTSFLRWVTRRGPRSVGECDTVVPYASGQAASIYGLLCVCVVETVALAYLIPWPVVHAIVLVLDVWGVYFIVALHASCVVRPHVIGADGSLWLRYGAFLDIRIAARCIASARVERRFPEGGLAAANGAADLAVASQTTVTVELAEPVAFVRPLGKLAEARTFRFYAEDPTSAVAALHARAALERA